MKQMNLADNSIVICFVYWIKHPKSGILGFMPHLDVTCTKNLLSMVFKILGCREDHCWVCLGGFVSLFPPLRAITAWLSYWCTVHFHVQLSAWVASIGSSQWHYRVTFPSDSNSWSHAKDFVICHYNPIQQNSYLIGMRTGKAFIWLHHKMINESNLCSLWEQHPKENVVINFVLLSLPPWQN